MLEILGEENIYRLPDGLQYITELFEIPQYESPESLKNKYIVKCKCKRIQPELNKGISTSII